VRNRNARAAKPVKRTAVTPIVRSHPKHIGRWTPSCPSRVHVAPVGSTLSVKVTSIKPNPASRHRWSPGSGFVSDGFVTAPSGAGPSQRADSRRVWRGRRADRTERHGVGSLVALRAWVVVGQMFTAPGTSRGQRHRRRWFAGERWDRAAGLVAQHDAVLGRSPGYEYLEREHQPRANAAVRAVDQVRERERGLDRGFGISR
jgi:hypothetical protein